MLIRSIAQNAMDKKFNIRQFPSPEHPYIAFPSKNLAVLDISRFTTGEIGPQSRLSRRFIQEAAHQIREHLRVFEDYFREHFHDKMSTVTFCNANNKAFVSNPSPSNFPMFVTFIKT